MSKIGYGTLQAGQVGLVITVSRMHLVKVCMKAKHKTKWNYEPVAKVTVTHCCSEIITRFSKIKPVVKAGP
jgi:hypothetical protein